MHKPTFLNGDESFPEPLDFSHREAQVFNLRGNARTQGEQRQREKGNVFGSGSRAPIAITILVKNPAQFGKADIFYKDIGDYLTREQKLDAVKNLRSVLSDEFKPLTPNERGDWINQRGNEFEKFIPLHEVKIPIFGNFYLTRSRGLVTGRDAWIYNFSRENLARNVQTTIDYYNKHSTTEIDPTKFVWDDLAVQNKNRGLEIEFDGSKVVEGMYRPFCKSNLYYEQHLIQRRYQMQTFFPTGTEDNSLICVNGIGSNKELTPFIVNKPCDLGLIDKCQCYPLYYYESERQGSLFGENMTRRDGISEFIMNRAIEQYGASVSKEDIFYYVYGFLHLPSYRAKFANELKKSLPRIILIDDAEKFWRLSRAGRDLAAIHLNYEQQEPAQVEIIGGGDYRVKKMRLSKDKTLLQYNERITIKNIPARAFEYVVNGRSPLEWVIERYQIKKDKASGIINDPNDWATEHGNPRYILDLVLSSITVSLKTLDIVENLPDVEF